MFTEVKRGPGRPRKIVHEIPGGTVLGPPETINVRMGPRACMTSQGLSAGSDPRVQARIRQGIIIPLPYDEAVNLVDLGYATRV
jgi:hypothetical protein